MRFNIISALLKSAQESQQRISEVCEKSRQEIEADVSTKALLMHASPSQHENRENSDPARSLKGVQQGLWHGLYAELWKAAYARCPTDPVACAKKYFGSLYDSLCANFIPMKDVNIKTFQIGFPGNEYIDDMVKNHHVIPVNQYKGQTMIIFGIENMYNTNADQIYGVNIGSGHDFRHCAYIDCIADMTNPRHFMHLPAGAFEILNSEHIPLELCWCSPFFQNANILLKKGGKLVFPGGYLEEYITGLTVPNRRAFLKTPTEFGFSLLEGPELDTEKQKLTSLQKKNQEWEGLCLCKTKEITTLQKRTPITFPDVAVLLDRSTTFFEATMFCKAAWNINSMSQVKIYSDDDLAKLGEKHRNFYNEIVQMLSNMENADLMTLEDASREPEQFYKFLSKCSRTGYLTEDDLFRLQYGAGID